MILQRMFSGQPSKPKKVKVSAADNKKLDELYNKWNKSGKQEDAEAYMNLWTEKVYIPHRKAGIMVDPDTRIARAAYDSAPLTVEKKFSEEKNEKAAKVGKEIGMVGGSLGVGALAGVGVHKLAKNSDKHRERLAERIEKGLEAGRSKYFKRWKEAEGEEAKKLGAKVDKAMKRKDSLKNLSGKLEKVTKPVSEFARTKGGKWALIGGTTAALGGAAYLEAKKKDRKEK